VRTLVQPIERWLKIGHEPRAVLRITDAASGAELLRIGVEASGTAEDRMTGDSPRISRTIPHEGGMSTVGSVTIEDLILDDDLTLCTDLTIEPTIEGPVRGAGRLLSIGTPGEVYADVRDDTTSEWDDVRMVVGRWYTGSDTHVVARAPIQFAIPSTVTSCEDGYIALTGVNDYHGATHWSVHLVAGTWSALSEKGDMFDNFTGHAASGDYTLVDLGEAWTTEEYGAVTYIQLNEAGRAAVVAAKGSSLKLMLVSDRDADFTTYSAGADGNEYVMFDAPTARLVLRTNTINLENQIASLYFGVDPLPADYTGMDLVFTGVVDRYDITDRILSLTLTPNDHKKNPMLPKGIITTATFPNCPEEHVGEGYPMVYGSASDALMGAHEAGIGYEKNYVSHTLTNEEIGLFDYFPCPVVDPGNATADGPMRVLVSSGAIKRAFLGAPAVWNGTARAWARMLSYTSLIQGTTHRYIDLYPDRRIIGSYDGVSYSDADIYEEFFGHVISLIPSYVQNSDGVTSPEDVYGAGVSMDAANDQVTVGFSQETVMPGAEKIEVCFSLTTTGNCEIYCKILSKDADFKVYGGDGVAANHLPGFSTFTSASVDFNAAGVTTADHIVIFGATGGIYSEISSIDSDHVLIIPAIVAASSLEFKIIKAGAVVHSFTNIMKNTIGTADVVLDATQYLTETLDNYYVQILKFAHSAGVAQVSYLQVKYYTQPSETIREIGLDKQGAMYGTWISGRAGGHSSGDLIELPAHIVESIGRDGMDLATAEINTSAFDAAATALAGMKMAFQISERKRAREYLKDLAYQGRMKLWWDDRDRLKAKVFAATAAYPVSGSNIPALLDVFTETGEPSGDSFTTHQIVGEPKIRRRLDEMKNDFVFRYRLNHATGEYGAVITCNKDGTTLSDGDLSGVTGAELVALCQAAYDETGSVETLEVEAWAVRDDATAAQTVQHLVQRLATMPWEITFEAGPSANVFEEADFVNIRCGVVQNRLGIAQMRKQKWEIIGHEPDVKGHDVGITAVQVV
jgi:hypothetical protein